MLFVNHFLVFWYISIPTALAVLVFVIITIKHTLLRRHIDADEKLAREAVAHCLGYSADQAEGLRIVRRIYGGKDEGFMVSIAGELIVVPRYAAIYPKTMKERGMYEASRAVEVHLGKYRRATRVDYVMCFVLVSCLATYMASMIYYLYTLT